MRSRARFVLLLASFAAVAGCDKTRSVPGTPADGTYDVPTGDPTGGSGGPTATLAAGQCARCHGTPGLDNANADPLVAAAPPRTLSGSSSGPAVGAHRAHLQDGPYRRAVECASCHLLPTGSEHPAQRQGKVSFSRLSTTSWNGSPLAPTWDGNACSSTYCHGNFTNGSNAAPAWTAGGSVTCGSCHGTPPGGSHPTLAGDQSCGTCHGGSFTDTSVDLSLHMDGVLAISEPAGGGGSCGGCHSAIFAAMNGTTPHASRHALGLVLATNTSFADSGLIWADPLSSNAAADRSCVNMCHGDHPHDLTSPATATHEANVYVDASTAATRANGTADRIGVGGTGGTPNRARTDFDGTQATGGLCVSCHWNPIVSGGPVVDKAAFDASAHDYASNSAGGNDYSWGYQLHDGGVFARNCTKCHASRAEGTTPVVGASGSAPAAVHFGDDTSLLAGTTNPAGTSAGFVCYNCHGSAATPAAGAQGDRSGKDIQSQIAHATASGQSGHPADSNAVHDSAAEQANASFGNALGVAAGADQRHSSCLDCHDPHRVKPGTHAVGTNLAGPPLEGAWGARLSSNPAFWTAPTNGNFTKTSIVAGTDVEATLCFKCHSAFYWGNGTPPTSPGLGAAETDTAREFNPSNAGNWATVGTSNQWSGGESAGSFHPILATAGSNLGAIQLANLVTTNFAWSTATRNLMACTDCHASDTATDLNGPHGSAAKFVLRGPNTGWSEATVMTDAGMPDGTFCANCHDPAFQYSRFSLHYELRAHRVACFDCHSAIVHGAPRPGFLNPMAGTNTTDLPAIDGYDNAAPYAQPPSGSTHKLFMKSYPSTQTAGWSKSNCGCNGTNHDG